MTIISRDEVVRRLQVPATLLVRYESRGLVRSVRQGEVEGYEPSELRRVWTVVSLHRDLGINLAGIEAILKLRTHIDEIHSNLSQLAHKLSEALESDDDGRA